MPVMGYDRATPQEVGSTVKLLLRSARPKQWTKNLLVFMAFLFTLNLRWDLAHPLKAFSLFGDALLAFVILCAVSSAEYLINDVVDMERDKIHPKKRMRPLASGLLKKPYAIATSIGFLIISIPLSFYLNSGFGGVVLLYVLLALVYTFYLKYIVILDVLAISAGFVLRAVAGAVIISVPISPWLYVCTTLGALLLALGKRRHELTELGSAAQNHRTNLGEYTPQLLDQMISVVAPSLLVAYSLYSFSAENLPKNHAMMFTIPFVFYGIFRYLYLVHTKNMGGSPEEILISDMPLLVDILLWLVSAVMVLLVFRT